MGCLKAGISDTYLNVRIRIMRHVRRGWPCWLREEKLLWDYFHSVKKAQRAVLTGSFHDTQDGCRANRCTSPGDGKQAQRGSFPEVFSFRACPVAFSPGVYVQLSVLSAISFFFPPSCFEIVWLSAWVWVQGQARVKALFERLVIMLTSGAGHVRLI